MCGSGCVWAAWSALLWEWPLARLWSEEAWVDECWSASHSAAPWVGDWAGLRAEQSADPKAARMVAERAAPMGRHLAVLKADD